MGEELEFKKIFDMITTAQQSMRNFLDNHHKEIVHDQDRIKLELPIISKASDIVSRKWAIQILWLLEINKDVIFNDFIRFFEGISSRSLSNTLKHLKTHGLISRTVESTRPPRVHYALNEKGKGFVELALMLVFYLNKDL